MIYKASFDLAIIPTIVSNEADKEQRSSSPPLQEEPISLRCPITLNILALWSMVATTIINIDNISLEKQTHDIMTSLRNEKCKTNLQQIQT